MQIRKFAPRALCAAVAATTVAVLGHSAAATDLSTSTTGHLSGYGTAINYRLFHPTDARPGEKKPLVLFLQGMGDRGTDNVRQTDWIDGLVKNTKSGEHSAYVLAPQIDTKSWFQSYGGSATPAMKLTIDALKQTIKNENVDTSRVYVTGLSMGGMGTWDILQRAPGTFAAAVPMSGGGDEKSVSKFSDVPVWAFHGDADTIVPVGESRTMVDALRKAGGDVKYTEVKGGGHVIWDDVYEDRGGALYDWMFSQSLGGDEEIVVPAQPVASVSAPKPVGLGSIGGGGVDFSDAGSSVPEPGTLSLVGVAGAALLRRRNRRA